MATYWNGCNSKIISHVLQGLRWHRAFLELFVFVILYFYQSNNVQQLINYHSQTSKKGKKKSPPSCSHCFTPSAIFLFLKNHDLILIYPEFKFNLTGFFFPYLYLLFTHNKTLVSIKIIHNTVHHLKLKSEKQSFSPFLGSWASQFFPSQGNHHYQFLVCSSRYFKHLKSTYVPPPSC